MTLPVPVIPGASLLNTRRTIWGVRHLAPDPVVNQILLFTLAYTAEKHSIGLYAFIALSTHLHDPFHDPLGRHPDFRRDFHSLVTRNINNYRGVNEAKWSPNRQSPVLLADIEAILDAIAYTIANAVLHHLVDSPEDWPGAISLIEDLAGPGRMIQKPEGFFDPDGDVPDEVELRFIKPPMLADWTDEEYRAEIRRRVEAKCEFARKERKAKNIRVLGREAILAQNPKDCVRRQPKLFKLNPRIKCGDRSLRRKLLKWLSTFRTQHERARRRFRRGERDTPFPVGTFLMERLCKVVIGPGKPPPIVLVPV